MCGRFSQLFAWQDVNDLFDLAPDHAAINLQPRYNGAPTQDFIACLVTETGIRVVRKLRWGLVPYWAKDRSIGARMINASSETVAEKPSFRNAFRQRRCLVPANGWFEWQRSGEGKLPHYIRKPDSGPMAFAGIWERWTGEATAIETFSILTRDAIPELHAIHHRQPVVIEPPDFDNWLDSGQSLEVVSELIRAIPPEFCPVRVSSLVNNARNNVAEVHDPVNDDARQQIP